MRFERKSLNDDGDVLVDEFEGHLTEVENTLKEADYMFQRSNQDGREDEIIFDPKGTNSILQGALEDRDWKKGVNVTTEGYGGGNDIDIYKDDVGGEIQFSHYTSLDSDINRLQALSDGRLELQDSLNVDAGVVVVVKNEMPTSNSVSHFDQAIERAAPILIDLPVMVYGIESPKEGEEVILNEYENMWSRDIIDYKEIDFEVEYFADEDD